MGDCADQLTASEMNVLKLIVEGKKNKEIAKTIHVSVSTANSYVQSILDKTGIHDRKLLIVRYLTVSKNSNINDVKV